jgi:hypothetical protein
MENLEELLFIIHIIVENDIGYIICIEFDFTKKILIDTRSINRE